jgi:hypothetical protein|tara:strand:+ start:175 stop:1575 length:1401 start_codon:yes stop_codon:yes gene_type:complete
MPFKGSSGTTGADAGIYNWSDFAASSNPNLDTYNFTGDDRPLRTATKVVAASDASQSFIDMSDYQCDGTADDVQIQQAIDALPSGGGRIMLTEGTFTLGAQITLPAAPVRLEGQGQGSTIVTCKNSFNTDMFLVGASDDQGTVLGSIGHMTIDGNSGNQTSGSGIRQQSGNRFTISRCYITNCKEHGIYIEGVDGSFRSDYTIVHACWVHANLKHGIFVENPSNDPHIADSWISDNGVNTSTYDNIAFSNIADFSVVGNNIWQGKRHNLSIDRGGPGQIISNTFNTAQESNIAMLTSIGGVQISGNTFHEASARTSGTYPHIVINGTSGQNSIVGNWFSNVNETVSDNITEEGSANQQIIAFNNIDPNSNSKTMTVIGADTKVFGNREYVTENSGTATLANGNTSIVVSHGLSVTPAAGDIMITPIEAWGSMTEFYIDTYTSTQFTIHSDQDPGQDVDFAWKAIVL